MKNIRVLFSEYFQFLEAKFSIYLNRHVFVMIRIKNVREKSRECHNYLPQPFPDSKRKRKQTNPNMRKSDKRKKSAKISFLFPKRGNRNAKRTKTNTRTK